MGLEGDGKAGRGMQRDAVNGLDVERQELGSVGVVGGVKTGRRPFEVQVAAQKPGMLCRVGEGAVGASTRGKVAVPLVGQMQTV